MDKQKKHIPIDSTVEEPESNKIVKQKEDTVYKREEPTIRNPAGKRKYSEQPPTKHNSKT